MIAAGPLSNTLHPVVLPMIAHATCGKLESSFLAKDGITLWLAVARNIPLDSYSNDLDQLFLNRARNIFDCDLLSSDVEDIKEVMLMVEGYILAGGRQFLVTNASVLQYVYSKVLGQVSPRAVPYVTRTIEALVLACPEEACLFLIQSGALLSLLRACAAAVPQLSQVLQDFGEADVAVVSYLSIVSRLCLISTATLQTAVTQLAEHCGRLDPDNGPGSIWQDPLGLLTCLLRLLIDKFDSVGYCSAGTWRRRMWSIALLSLYPTDNAVFLDWLAEVVNVAADVISEESVSEGQSRASRIVDSMLCADEDMVVWSNDDDDDDDEGLEDGDRPAGAAEPVEEYKEPIAYALRRILAIDIVANTSVRALAREKVLVMRSLLTAEQFMHMAATAGESTISAIIS